MASVLFLVWPNGADAFFHRPEHDKYFRTYEVVARFVAEGKEFTARGVFGCWARVTGNTILPGYGRMANFSIYNNWMGKRLPSGAAVLFRTPAELCREGGPGYSGGRSVPSWFFPPVFWIDNADNPTVMEAYVSRIYYEYPSPRVRVLSFKVNPSKARRTDPRKEIGWLASGPKAFLFVGYIARPVPESQWRKVPEVAAILRTYRKAGSVTREQHMSIIRSFHPATSRAIQTQYRYRSLPGPGVPSATPIRLAANRGTYPIRRLNGANVLDRRRPGLVVYYRRPFGKGVRHFPLTLRVNGRASMVCQLTNWCFDPKSKLMISVAYEVVGSNYYGFRKFDENMRRRYGK